MVFANYDSARVQSEGGDFNIPPARGGSDCRMHVSKLIRRPVVICITRILRGENEEDIYRSLAQGNGVNINVVD
jgi:hypothetical protein